MKIYCLSLAIALSLAPALAQTGQSVEPPPQSTAADQVEESQASGQGEPQRESRRSAVEVKPGPPVIQQKDLYEETGVFRPLLRMPKYVLQDQRSIWTSPFHTAKSDIKWWAIFGGATAALIATDQWSVKALRNSDDQIAVSTWGSRLGSAYSLIPISSAFYFAGTARHEERFRE